MWHTCGVVWRVAMLREVLVRKGGGMGEKVGFCEKRFLWSCVILFFFVSLQPQRYLLYC